MRTLDDGHVAISYEDRGGTIRALDHVPEIDHPPFVAVCEVTRLSDDIAKLHAAAGALSRRHMRLVVRLLLEQGYRLAYIDRAQGRVMPMANRIADGDWAGWWRLDLVSARLGVVAVPTECKACRPQAQRVKEGDEE